MCKYRPLTIFRSTIVLKGKSLLNETSLIYPYTNACQSLCLLVATYQILIVNCPRAAQGFSPVARIIVLSNTAESVKAESNKESRNYSPYLYLIIGGFLYC